MESALIMWLREHAAGWQPSIVGVFCEDAPHPWPITASSPGDLREQLSQLGHLLPLPSEPAALANVMEIELKQHLGEAASELSSAVVLFGTERSYPDLEFGGRAFGGGHHAVDIKCARRKPLRSGERGTTLNNRIALYTGNTYFLWPQLKFGSISRPFEEFDEHISIVVIYTFEPDLPERITDVQVVVHETWRIASRARASATREYIGSVQKVDRLIAGEGEFESARDFYGFWRQSARNWKKSPEAEKLLRQALSVRPSRDD